MATTVVVNTRREGRVRVKRPKLTHAVRRVTKSEQIKVIVAKRLLTPTLSDSTRTARSFSSQMPAAVQTFASNLPSVRHRAPEEEYEESIIVCVRLVHGNGRIFAARTGIPKVRANTRRRGPGTALHSRRPQLSTATVIGRVSGGSYQGAA
ncbi:MAG: hypothetical protein JWO13_2301 [Acidobacteriales bacterium]|nr:hypothetical protein [Terriglobales bacterium]